jgi:Uma2 family endonuclease
MDVSVARARFTRADYERLPEGFPAQLVDGWLVKEPSPTYGHQWVVGRVYRALAALVGDRAIVSPIDVGVDDENVYQPDVVVVPEVPSGHVRDVGIPVVAFEVLSPSTARRDRRKLARLLAAGVREVWLIDLDAGVVERHDREGVRRATGDDALASDAVPGFAVTPSVLFSTRRP